MRKFRTIPGIANARREFPRPFVGEGLGPPTEVFDGFACVGCSGGEKWEASIWVDGRQRYLGSFEDERFAARIYDIAALTLKGDRVKTNFAKEEYENAMREIQALAMRESEGNNKVGTISQSVHDKFCGVRLYNDHRNGW